MKGVRLEQTWRDREFIDAIRQVIGLEDLYGNGRRHDRPVYPDVFRATGRTGR